MIGYKVKRFVIVFSGVGQTLSDELRFHILATDDDLYARFQIKNPAICLQSKKGDNETVKRSSEKFLTWRHKTIPWHHKTPKENLNTQTLQFPTRSE